MRAWAVASLLVALVPAGAGAHAGRFPEAQQVLVDGRTGQLVVVTSIGLLFPTPEGWAWTCRAGMDLRLQENPVFALSRDGAIVGATFDGLIVGEACAFERALPRQVTVDVHADARGVLYAPTSNGGGGNALFRSDDGARWESVAALPEPALFERARTAPSRPETIYVAGFVLPETPGDPRDAAVRASDDGGATWREHRVPLDPGELTLLLDAVDPDVPARVHAHTLRDPNRRDLFERLLVTDDGGATWTEVARVPRVGAFAIAGGELFVGGLDPGEPTSVDGPPRRFGLWRGRRGEPLAHVFDAAQVKCLLARDDALYACFGSRSPFEVGRSDDRGASFSPVMRFSDVVGPVACDPGEATRARCEVEEDDHNREHFGLLDAGPFDAGVAPAPSGGGCHAVPTRGAPGAGWLALALATGLAWGSRRAKT